MFCVCLYNCLKWGCHLTFQSESNEPDSRCTTICSTDMLFLERPLLTCRSNYQHNPWLKFGGINAATLHQHLMRADVIEHYFISTHFSFLPHIWQLRTQCKMEVRIWSGKTYISKWPKSGCNWWNMINIVHIYAKQCEIMQTKINEEAQTAKFTVFARKV